MCLKSTDLKMELIRKMVSKHCKVIFRQKEGVVESFDGHLFTIRLNDGTVTKPVFQKVDAANHFYFFDLYKPLDAEIDKMQRNYISTFEAEQQEEKRKAKIAQQERIKNERAAKEAEEERRKKEKLEEARANKLKALYEAQNLDDLSKFKLNKNIEDLGYYVLTDWCNDNAIYKIVETITDFAEKNIKEALFVMPDVYKLIGKRGDCCLGQYKKKAFKIYKYCADHGDAFSQYRTGYMYETGFGIKKDISMAIYYYNLGQAQGNEEAICAMAWLLYKGQGVPKNEKKAMDLYKRVFTKEELKTFKKQKGLIQYKVFDKFYSGNLEESLVWLKKASLAGSVDAQCLEALLYCDVKKMRNLAKKKEPDAIFCMAGLQDEFSEFVPLFEAHSWLKVYKSLFPNKDSNRLDIRFKGNYGLS